MHHKKVYFVDFNTKTVQEIRENIAKLNKKHDALLLRQTVAKNIPIARKILRENKSFCTISHFKNRAKSNITHFASATQKQGFSTNSISFHSIHDLPRLRKFRPKMVFLSPVFSTKTHPNAKPLGKIQTFKLAFEIKKQLPQCEIYLLGGMTESRFLCIKNLDFTRLFSGYGFIRGR